MSKAKPAGRKSKARTRTATARTRTIPWDAVRYLATEQDVANYLEAVFEDSDPALVAAVLGDVARSRGMARIARATGLGRESLYKALSPAGNPEFATVLKVMRALGLKLKVAAQNASCRRLRRSADVPSD
jgi:probable addiction module antidote protein